MRDDEKTSGKPTFGVAIDPETGLESGVYRIRCTANGKVYIGSAIDFARRWGKHLSELGKNRHHSRHLQFAWHKYGPLSFAFEVIEWVEPDRLIEREQAHIDAACSADRRQGFNICSKAGSCLGVKHTAETKRKLSEATRGRKTFLGRKHSAETKRKMSEWQCGRKISEEARQKMLGRRCSAETRRKLSEANLGHKRSAESIQKSSEGNRGRKHSEESKRKRGAALRGRTFSEESRQKMRDAWARRKHLGEDNPQAKLTRADVEAIMKVRCEEGIGAVTICRRLGLPDADRNAVDGVIQGKSWTHVTGLPQYKRPVMGRRATGNATSS